MQGNTKENKKLNIQVTYEHDMLNPFYAANGLEIAEDEPVSTDTLKSWVIMKDDMFEDTRSESRSCSDGSSSEHGASEADPVEPSDANDPLKAAAEAGETIGGITENIMGACTLAFREGEYIIDGIALAPESRGSGAGTALLAAAEAEVRARGGGRVYLVARAPEFFRTNSYETIARSDAPEFFECFGCDQYNKSCFPEVMRHVL